jgi:hypothetical protein
MRRLLLCALLLAAAAPARAESPEQAAQRLLKQGQALLKKGDYGQAVIVLMKAQGTFPSAEIQLEIAAAYEGLGSPVEAAELYERLLGGEGLFGKNRERAQQQIEALRAKLGRLTIECRIKDADVKVNGREVGKTPLPFPVYVEPGEVSVEVQNPAHRVTEDHTLAAGEHKKIVINLAPKPAAPSQPPTAPAPSDLPPPTAALPPPTAAPPAPKNAAPAARPAESPRRTERDGGWILGRRWTWIAVAGAVVAGGVGMGLGISASSEYSEYKDPATSVSRYPELEDSIEAKSTAANAMFGVAGGLALTAAVLYFVEPLLGPGDRRASTARSRWVGLAPGGLSIGGAF